LGSGIKRALEAWPKIDFLDDREGCLFIATVHRSEEMLIAKGTEKSTEKTGKSTEKIEISTEKTRGGMEKIEESGEKTKEVILHLLTQNPRTTIKELSEAIQLTASAIEKQLRKLKREGKIERLGPDKGGYWKIK